MSLGWSRRWSHFSPNQGPNPCPAPNPTMGPGTATNPGRRLSGPCFRATLRIRAGWPIPRDSIAQLASAGLLQGQALRILPGQDRGHPLADGDRIHVVGREADLVEQLGRLTDSLQTLVEQTIAPALAGIAEQIAALQELLGTGPAAKGRAGPTVGGYPEDTAGSGPAGRPHAPRDWAAWRDRTQRARAPGGGI